MDVAPLNWSLKFDEPIAFANGEMLRTLLDAGNYITKLPITSTPHAAAAEGDQKYRARSLKDLTRGRVSWLRSPRVRCIFNVDDDGVFREQHGGGQVL